MIDDQIFLRQRRGGISKSFVELASALATRNDTSITMQACVSINQHLGELRGIHRRIGAVRGATQFERPLHAINRFLTQRGTFDVVHHTYYLRDRLRDIHPARSVSTVHDMTPEDFPEFFPSGSPHDAKVEFLRASAGIVCDSNAALARLRAHTDLSYKPIAVVHLGVRPELRPDAPALVALPARYVLHVGRRDGYKQGAIALRAFSILARRDRTLHLVIAGGGPLSDYERDLLEGADRVLILNPTDAQMPGIYAHALAFVSASTSEGFGMPVLEAMASGSPVVVAANDAYLEVAGEAGNFFAVRDVEGCADVLAGAIGRGSVTIRRIMFGLQRSRDWTWARAAAELREFYTQVLTS